MYGLPEDYIETAPEGESFGNHQSYKYRVMGRDKLYPTHHTNSYEDAKNWSRKCINYWIEQDALSE